jgi:hypothetical protein
MFDIRTVPDTDLLVASRHLAGGASHSPLAGRTVTKQTVYSEIRRRQLSIDPPPGPAIETDPAGPYRWDLEVDENDGYLCPMPDGETAGRCRAELIVEGTGWEYLGLDCEMARPLTDVHVESWTVRCTNGHVLEIGPNDGNGAPAFRLDRFLTGEGHTDDEDEPAVTQPTNGQLSAVPPEDLDELIEWADLGIVYKADPRDLATTIKRLATQLRESMTPPATKGCIDCNPDAHDGDEYRCPACLPAFERHARETGAREGCGDPKCPHEVTHQHRSDGSLPGWLVDQVFEDARRAVEPDEQ